MLVGWEILEIGPLEARVRRKDMDSRKKQRDSEGIFFLTSVMKY